MARVHPEMNKGPTENAVAMSIVVHRRCEPYRDTPRDPRLESQPTYVAPVAHSADSTAAFLVGSLRPGHERWSAFLAHKGLHRRSSHLG